MTNRVSVELLTAYVLGEAEEESKKELEILVDSDDQVRAAVESVRAVAEQNVAASKDEDEEDAAVSDEHRALIREAATKAVASLSPEAEAEEKESPAASEEEESDLFARFESPDDEQKNSVLFSQSSLEDAVRIASTATDGREEDTSGLLDIRALAKVSAGEPPADTTGMDFHYAPSSFAPPVLAPRTQKKKHWTAIALGASVLVCTVLVTVLMNTLFAPKQTEITQLSAKIEELNAQMAKRDAANGSETTPETAKLLEEIARLKAEKAAHEMGSGKPRKKSRKSSSAPSEAQSSPTSPDDTKGSVPADGSKNPSKSDLDDLLGAAPASKPAASSDTKSSSDKKKSLPVTLTKKQVKLGLAKVAPTVKKCGGGASGTIKIKVVISGATGRVRSAKATDEHAGTPIGACAERAVKKARFHDFQRPSLSVTYPFKL